MTTDEQEPQAITLEVQDGTLGQDARTRHDNLRSLVEEELQRGYDIKPWHIEQWEGRER